MPFILTDQDAPLSHSLGVCAARVEAALDALDASAAARRIWQRDGSWWSADAQVRADIESRLGWLDLPESMVGQVPALKAWAQTMHSQGIQRIALLGMGGSSLAPEVMRAVLGLPAGMPDLTVLDTTDPAQIRRFAQGGDLRRTLCIVASKSGNTAEADSLLAYFGAALQAEVGSAWARHMAAITDPGTPLEALARQEGFAALYLAPSDVGGRYSALSVFGLVPAALIGANIAEVLMRAQDMARACQNPVARDNPGLLLGAILGALAADPTQPRDKLTLLASPELAPFGPWVEQLIAESTGKLGRGILPVVDEPLGPLSAYRSDRLFVYLRLESADNAALDQRAQALIRAGHPLVALPCRDVYDLGAEFFRWEFATAVAGQILGINPFDQPDVESAKAQAREALARYQETRALPQERPLLSADGLTLYGEGCGDDDLAACLRRFFGQASSDGYIALMAFMDRSAENAQRLQHIQGLLHEKLRLAVTVGVGPRFLHSTGQLHKGGPNQGLFVQITHDEKEDLAIPGRDYTFGILKQAQALGDLAALRAAGRRVVRVHLNAEVAEGLGILTKAIERALE